MFQYAAVRVFRLAAVAACLVHGTTAMASGGRGAGAVDSSRATVFLRVIGDIEVVADRETTPIARTRLQRTNVEIATGSGFLFSSIGQILTCHHVISDGERTGLIEGKKTKVLVRVRRIEAMLPATGGPDGLPASGPYEATVVASNPDLDIAVLSISGASFPTLDLGDSDALEPGDGLDNASVFRASLASIEGEALRRHAPTVPRPAAWAPAVGLDPSSLLAEVKIPAGWRQEPDGPLPCEGLPPASNAVTASPLADFTRSVRAAVVRQSGLTAARAATACGTPLDEEPDRYQRTITSFGTRLFVEGKFVQVAGDAVLHYQMIGPADQSAALRDLFALWLSRLAGSARISNR